MLDFERAGRFTDSATVLPPWHGGRPALRMLSPIRGARGGPLSPTRSLHEQVTTGRLELFHWNMGE
jgi:hypothetical protein